MDVQVIKNAMKFYRETKSHEKTKKQFGFNDAQEYAVNSFGRKKNIAAEILADNLDKIASLKTVGDIAVQLGYPAEAALE